MLNEGDPAPDFELEGDDMHKLRLSQLIGRPVVLYFYPKDDTSGCTREAKDFSCLAGEFAALGVEVIGIAPGDVASKQRFKAKHGLAVRLAADPQRSVIEAYGVWAEKSMYGRMYMGVERTTFLIDADGRIGKIWRKVKVPEHAAQVLEAARNLAGKARGAATSGPA
jgi:peroxiredoxin Q/BCP